MLPDEVISVIVSAVLRDTYLSFGVTRISMIITETRKSQCNNSISKVLVVIHAYSGYVGWK